MKLNSASPFCLLPRFRRAYRELESLAERKQWSRCEIEGFQLDRINNLWRSAVQHVRYYRQLRNELALPVRFSSLAEFRQSMPPLPKAEVRTRPQDFLSQHHGPGDWNSTGGSTGVPTQVFWGKLAHLEMLRGKYSDLAQWDIDIFERTAFLWGHQTSFAPGMKGWIKRLRQPVEDWARNRMRLSAYHLSPADLQSHLLRLQSFRPQVIYAYSTAAHLLAEEAIRQRAQLDSLKAVICAGEPVFPATEAVIEQAFGVPTLIEYGSVECGFLAGSSPDGTLRVREDNVLLETLPRDDGRWDIVVTVLTNPAFPLIRYAIGDVTDRPLIHNESGFSQLHNVAGRDNDVVVAADGQIIHPARIEAIFESTVAIRRYRVQQHADARISVMMELSGECEPVQAQQAVDRLQTLVEQPVSVEVVDKMPQTPAGKHRFVVSQLASEVYSAREDAELTMA